MAATLAVTVLFSMFALASTAPGTPTGSDTTRADTTQPSPRIVRRFPIIEVRAPLHDLRSSQTVRVIPGAALRRGRDCTCGVGAVGRRPSSWMA